MNIRSLGRMWFHYRGTALHMAVERGAVPYVKLFLEHGANPDISGKSHMNKLVFPLFGDNIPVSEQSIQ